MSDEKTLTDEQTDHLKTGTLFNTLAKDPKYRPRVLALLKEANPDAVIPELDIVNGLDARVEERVKPYEETIKGLTEKVDKLQGHVARESWAAKQGLAEEELLEVEQLAKEAKIGSGDHAVEYWRMKNALGQPRSSRKPADDTYVQTLAKISPTNGPALKRAATAEALRILSETKTGRIRSA